MPSARLVLLIAGLHVPFGVCRAQDDERVKFGAGFFNEEKLKDQSWRWMGEEGIVKLRNLRSDMILKVSGRPVVDAMPAKPVMKVFLNGEQLEEFRLPEKIFEKEYKVPAAKLGAAAWIELRITTSKVVVPSEINPKSSDDRQLGFKLHKLTWESAGGAEPRPVPEEAERPTERPAETPSRGWLMAFLLIGSGVVVLIAVGLAIAFFVVKRRSPSAPN